MAVNQWYAFIVIQMRLELNVQGFVSSVHYCTFFPHFNMGRLQITCMDFDSSSFSADTIHTADFR